MSNIITQRLATLVDQKARLNLFYLFEAAINGLHTSNHQSAALAVGSPATTAKIGSAARFSVNGTPMTAAANTQMGALSGTVPNGEYSVWVFVHDGTSFKSIKGSNGTAANKVQFPALTGKEAVFGYVLIHPTGTGDFVGGTTPLNDATVAPNAVYVNVTGAFNPRVLG